MKFPKTIMIVALVMVVTAVVIKREHPKHIPLFRPPAPIKKWEFTARKSIVQDCAKSSSGLDSFISHRCDSRIPESYPEHSPAIDADGTIYVGGDKGLYALNADGTVKWFHELEISGHAIQVGYEPVLYSFIDDKNRVWFEFKTVYGNAGVVRMDANNQEVSTVSAAHSVTQTGLLKDGTIFVLWDSAPPAVFDPDGTRQANGGFVLNGNIRQEWWDGEFGVPRDCHPPAFGAGNLRYVGCNGRMIVLEKDGSKKWSFDLPGHWISQPAIAEDGTVYFGATDSNVYAFDQDGKLKWKFTTGDKVLSTPAIARNGTIFLGSNDTYLYAVGADGKVKWEFKTGGQVFSPTIGPDGTIYALSTDGKLYAIQDLEQNGGLWGQWAKWAGRLDNSWRSPIAD